MTGRAQLLLILCSVLLQSVCFGAGDSLSLPTDPAYLPCYNELPLPIAKAVEDSIQNSFTAANRLASQDIGAFCRDALETNYERTFGSYPLDKRDPWTNSMSPSGALRYAAFSKNNILKDAKLNSLDAVESYLMLPHPPSISYEPSLIFSQLTKSPINLADRGANGQPTGIESDWHLRAACLLVTIDLSCAPALKAGIALAQPVSMGQSESQTMAYAYPSLYSELFKQSL